MDKSRNSILQNIKQNKPAHFPLPESADFALPPGSSTELFIEKLLSVGGACLEGTSYSAMSAEIKRKFPDAKHIWSGEAAFMESTITVGPETTPHELENLDLVIIRGKIGVAENGAVWVQEDVLPLRAAAFICLHLVILLDKDAIVGNMHQAYEQLSAPLPGFGVFISGPSKSADIEQSLVIGAQGPKSLTVCLL